MPSPHNTFAARYLSFISSTEISVPLPDETELLYPYENHEVQRVMKLYYHKYYGDKQKRIFLIGINPGRFGGGVTGIPFTDPEALTSRCFLDHNFTGGRELSSRFIYDMVDYCGGTDHFFSRYFLTSLSPLGFTWRGKNRNYYDTPALMKALKPWLVKSFQNQLDMGAYRHIAFSLGQGKNFKIITELNREYHFFDKILPLPHPRWIMQYRLKDKENYLNIYKDELTKAYEEAE
ncbi:DUF4918 family protein [Oceanispirochaeta crateris]|uniref:DUF4918 family protein n=1 Tax=Oceanispirochaeta crateris TaxID=2518645 RepID=A0A5C1QF84_9SPIO|nr:uracil-DNA glycosylase family protein [Oceanispirochaeta crateris]QEN06685.1 DUF4918 family protein [Oceanispirochaeta crateris]